MLFALCSTAVAEEYTGSAMGRNGDVNVSVVYEDGRIVSVTVGENRETPGVGDIAVAEMPGKIVEAQSLTVDVVSGATLTSTAILQATEVALTNAGVDVFPSRAPRLLSRSSRARRSRPTSSSSARAWQA